jgi:hypothetical protein
MHTRPNTLGLGSTPSPRWRGSNMHANPRRLDLTVSQVQDNYHPLMACLGE